MKVRIRFSKHGNMKYIGHLDLMRYFQKSMRRAGIPIRYSEGFSPHQIMSFASPLGTGLESDCEYMDIELTDGAQMQPEEGMRRLNNVMCDGMMILEWREMPDNTKTGMSTLSEAEYDVCCDVSQEEIDALLARESILIQKSNKKGEMTDREIRPLIYDLSKTPDGIRMRVSQGSAANLRPEDVLAALGRKISPANTRIIRLSMKLD